MERLPDDSLEWFLLRIEALERLSSSESDKKAVEAARALDPLPQQSAQEWEAIERQLTEVILGPMYLNASRSALMLRVLRMLPEDKERALDLVCSVYERIARDHAELRAQASAAEAFRRRATRVLAEAQDPSAALRGFFDNLRKRPAG